MATQASLMQPTAAPGGVEQWGDPSGSWRGQWSAVRTACGLLDARFRAIVRVTGSDRVTFLQGMVTNDVAPLHDGEGTYAALLTIQGRIVADMRIYALADELWLDLPAARVEPVCAALERFIVADDVELAVGDWVPLVSIEGPHADAAVQRLTGLAVAGHRRYGHRAVSIGGETCRIAAVTHTGERGWLICAPPASGDRVGAQLGALTLARVEPPVLDALRIEAGIPWYGRDMDESMLISEVGLEEAISFRKGCYLGQEVVERVAARGQVHRKLVGLTASAAAFAPDGAKLYRDATEVGWVTSTAFSPACDAVVALGYVRREVSELGTQLIARVGERELAMVATALPFYRGSATTQ